MISRRMSEDQASTNLNQITMKTETLVRIGGHKKIPFSSILMLKADSNYTLVYLNDGSQILSSTTIGILEKRLKDFQFFRPNRSIIVNLQYLKNFEGKSQTGNFASISLKNDTKIPISRRKTLEFLKIIQ